MMENHSKSICILVAAIFFMGIGSTPLEGRAGERKYPNRPIQVVIAAAPGGTDMIFRPFTEKMAEVLGQPMAFVFKPGASGMTGASFVAQSKPDGYTLIGTSNTPVMIAPLTKEADYSIDDFVPICRLVKTPLMVAVRTDSPWKSIKDIVAEAKKSPGLLTFSTSGVFSFNHLLMEMFTKHAGIQLTHVPCTGANPAVTALVGGHVKITSSIINPLVPHLRSGTLRPIMVFGKQRLKEFPDVPTCMDSGYPVALSSWSGFMGPKGISGEVVKTVYAACKKVVESHEGFVTDRLEKMSLTLYFAGPEEFSNDIKAENEVLKKIIKDLLPTVK